MSEENLVRQCAPTLAGIKTGTIFPAPFTSLAELIIHPFLLFPYYNRKVRLWKALFFNFVSFLPLNDL